MTSDKEKPDKQGSKLTGDSDDKTKAATPPDPEWADGLRQLYDSVVDEELPDSLRDLLSKLDEGD